MIKRNIYILCTISLLQGMVFYAPVATLYRQAAGLGVFQITLIESISLFLTICLEIPWGWLAERIGYKRTMLICCGLYFISKIVFWKAVGFAGFLLERILLSVVCAGMSGVDSAMLFLSCTGGGSYRVFSIHQNLGQLGILLAGGIYGLWIGEDYRLAAFLTVLSYGAAAVLSLGLKEVIGQRKSGVSAGKGMLALLRQQLGNRRMLCLLIAMALLTETHQTVTVFLSQLQYARSGMSHLGISGAYLLVNVLGLVGGFSAWICAKTGTSRMGTVCIAAVSAGCLLMGLSDSGWVSVLAVAGIRISVSLMTPLYMEQQNRLAASENRAAALSVNSAVQDSLGIFLNLIYGCVADVHLPSALFAGAGLCVIAVYCFRRSFAETR